jgi:formylglycine-generating enzyme required for sulfatase activity
MELPNLLGLLPQHFNWCVIPSGYVTIDYDEVNRKRFEVPAFAIAQYPITNAQYQTFVSVDDGYTNPDWWDYAVKAQQWRARNPAPHGMTFKGDDLPRTDISWFESIAFCRWLSHSVSTNTQHIVKITLPTEQQWQRAAQGDSTLMYPWGNTFDSDKCNSGDNGLMKTTPVTQYPTGVSPYNVFDMLGNVWEWCLNTWEGDRTEINLRASPRVLRGGSYSDCAATLGCRYRSGRVAVDRNCVMGFRIACIIE